MIGAPDTYGQPFGQVGQGGIMSSPGMSAATWNPQVSSSQSQFNDRSNYAPKLWQAFDNQKAPSWDSIAQKMGLNSPMGGGMSMYLPAPRYASEAPIWSQAQIAQRNNLSNAQIGSQTQQQINDTYSNLGKYGFATNRSPLAMSLANQAQGRGMMNQATASNDLQWNAAQGNAEQVQRAQLANLQASTNYAQMQGSYWGNLLGIQQGARQNALSDWLGARQNASQNQQGYAQLLAGLDNKGSYGWTNQPMMQTK